MEGAPRIFARRLAPGACGGGGAPGDVVSAAAGDGALAVGFERALVTLDLRSPSRLPTLGAAALDERLTHVARDGRFTYARTVGNPSWLGFRSSPRSALDPTGEPPARPSATPRSYAGSYAARLTGAALHIAWTAGSP